MALRFYLWDCLTAVLYTLLWFLEVLKLLVEIAGLYVALAFISVCGAVMYLLNLMIIFFLFGILELAKISMKSVWFLVIKVCDTSCPILRYPFQYILQMSSSTTEMEFSKSEDSNMELVRQCLDDVLGQVECILAKEESGFKQSPTLFRHEFQKEILLLHSLEMIIKKSVKLVKEKKVLENMQFLEKVVQCAPDDICLYQLKNPIPLENEYESASENDEIQLRAAQHFFQELDSYIQTIVCQECTQHVYRNKFTHHLP